MPRRHLVVLCFALLAWSVQAQEAPQGKTVRLLTVGNSFSQNATRYLGELAKADGNALIVHRCDIGGGSLAQHWEKTERFAADPTDQKGLYGSGRSLAQELAAEPWDVVTLQQYSWLSHDPATYQPFATQLHAFITERAPQATILIHETWEYRSDDPRFATEKPGQPVSQQAMYDGLKAAYEAVAQTLGVRLIPVGDAFHAVDTDPAWGFKPDAAFDPKTAQAPALPDQTHSLHTGWRWTKGQDGTPALRYDGHHAGMAGQYLGACVWYEVLFGESVVENAYVPEGMDVEWARYLQQTAHETVSRRAAAP